MDAQDTVLVSKVPMLKPNEFDMWKIRIRQYMLLTDYGMWEVVENGPGVDEAVAEGGARPPPRSDADRKRRQTEMKALSTLLLAIPNEYQHQFSTYTDAKSLWTALEKRFSGTKSTKRNQKAILKQQYENFTSLKNESMTQTFDRFNKIIGELETVDVKMDKDDVNRKFLRSLGEEWTIYTVSFRQGDDLEEKELEDLYNDLRIFEAEVEKKKRPIGYTHNTTLLSENPNSFNTTAFTNTTAAYNTTVNETVSNINSSSPQETNEDIVLEAFLASHVKSSLINDDLDQINADDLEEMDIKWQMAMLTLRMKRFIRRTGRNNFDLKRGDKAGFDKSKVRCYKCNEPGHFARECKGVATNNQTNGGGSAQAPRFNNRGSNSNPSSSQPLVSQEGQGFDWSDHAEEAVQNQALMAEIKETEIPTEVSSKLCSDLCSETVKKYRDHNQTMSDSIKKMERERREYVKIIDNLEDQIKAYKANELQFEYDHNYWKWEKKELERKLAKEKEEVESARKELSKAKEDLDKFSKSSKALESIIRAQVTDDLKRGIGYNSTPPPYNQNYIPPTTDLLERMDRREMKEGLDSVDPIDSEEETDRKSTAETIPDDNHLLTNEKGGMPFIPSKKVETTRKDKGKSVMPSETKGKKTETNRKENRKDHYTQKTVVEPGTYSQSQNKNHPRGNKRNWNNQLAQCHGVDLNKINRPKPCFICCKTNHLARDCYFNPFNKKKNKYQARRVVPTNKRVVSKQNRSNQPKRKVQKKKVEKKTVKLVTKWVPKASLGTTASTSSGNNNVASENSGNSIHSVEVNTAASNISSDNSNTANSNNSSGNSNDVTTAKSPLRKPIVTKYSSHEIPNKDYLLKLNRLTESNQGRRSSLWHMDSGCSRHMTGIMSLLEDFKKFEGGHVAFGDNPHGGKISGKGKVSKGKMTFDDVYFVEQLRYNLLSVSQVCDKKFGVFFTDTECLILAPGYKIDESKVMLRTPRKDNVYCLDIEDASSSSLNCLFSKASVSESSLWHRRMCRMNFKNMNLLVKNNRVRGLPAKEFSSDDHCVACLKGKQHKNSHKSKEVNTISSPLQLLHMDLFGPTNVMSIGKKSYCLVIVDDYPRFTWVYFLRTKDETSGLIKPFVTRVENKTNLRVKVIRSDNGTKVPNSARRGVAARPSLKPWKPRRGIERQYSAPRTPQQNGVAERRNRTLIEAARTMLADSKLPITFWAEAVNTACYVQNRVLVVKSKGKTPYELFEKRKPYIGFLQPFGCPCTILDTKTHLGKFESKSDDGFFVGYSSQSKALRVFNSSTRIIEESDNVKCNENTPNLPGSGPNWLFDIDSLTNSLNMSYSVNADSVTEQAQETSPTFVMFPMPLVDSNDACTTDEKSDDQTESGSAEKTDDQSIDESSPSQNLESIPTLEEGPQWDQEPEVNDSNLGVDLVRNYVQNGSTVTSTNNLSLHSILEKDKLTGSNFLDWERNLMIVLRHERKWYVLEEALGEAPPANAPAAARNAHKKHSDDLLDVACLMLATMSPDLQAGLINTNAYDMIRQLRDMFQTQARTERYDATKAFNECKMVKGTSVSDHVMKMKRHLDHLERLGHPVPLQLAIDTILNSLSEDYRPFVVNYNMNNMEKTIAELHSMLKTAELNMGNKNKTKDVLMVKDGGVKKKNGQASTSKGKGPLQAIQSAPKKSKGKGKGKKVKPNKARTENRCFICNEIGHWRQNCPKRHEAGRNHSSTQQLRKVAVLHIQELEVSPGSYDPLLSNSYKCCRLKVAQIFDRVANIGRDPRLRLLLGSSHNSTRRTFVGRSPVDYHQAIQKNHPPTLVIGGIQSPMITRKQSKSLPNPHLSMISVFLSQTEPKKAYDAMKDPSWIEAMQEELLQFVLQHVWDLVDLPRRHRVIGTKWIFRNKTDERGIVIKNKARLVAQGYTQEEGIDYDDVFAPVARIEAIRLFLAFASYKGFKVYQIDVKSAFLYGTIDEEVYVSQPPGFEDPKYPDKVYKLRKALYGLHQAPRAWYDTLTSYLLDNKFERGVIDKTLFIKRTETDMLLVQIYVDDIIFGSTKDDMCKEFEELMHKKFKMSSMGELTFFLGLQVKQKPEGIFINQSKYVASMLQKFGMNDAKPASTPMETHKHLTADVEGEEVDVHHYRSMIGSLMYLTTSRPDIMFAVCVCASDYGGANLDRKSTSGGCQYLGGRLVSWQCKKQTTVSQSTTEAEYIAASQCCSQALWIQNQMQDYGLSFLQTPIYIDNNSAISIVNNPVKHSKTKHIEIKCHFIRDCNEKKIIQVLKVHTDDQYADLFTKAFDVGRVFIAKSGMDSMCFIKDHNKVGYFKKDANSEGFDDILDFLASSHIAYAATINPIIYIQHMNDFWSNAVIQEEDGVKIIQTTICGHALTLTPAKIRFHLQLNDEGGISMLKPSVIMEAFQRMGYTGSRTSLKYLKGKFCPQWRFFVHTLLHCFSKKTTSFGEFSSSIASAMVCLATKQVFNFSQMIFDDLVYNLENINNSKVKTFYMFPRFIQEVITKELTDVPMHGDTYKSTALGHKVFANMQRPAEGSNDQFTPLFSTMMRVNHPQGEASGLQPTQPSIPSDDLPTPITNTIPQSLEKTPTPTLKKPHSSVKKVPSKEKDGHVVGEAQTTGVAQGVHQDSLNIAKTPTTATPIEKSKGGPRCQETKGTFSASARLKTGVNKLKDPVMEVNTPKPGEGRFTQQELMDNFTTIAKDLKAFEKNFFIHDEKHGSHAARLDTLEELVTAQHDLLKVHDARIVKQAKIIQAQGATIASLRGTVQALRKRYNTLVAFTKGERKSEVKGESEKDRMVVNEPIHAENSELPDDLPEDVIETGAGAEGEAEKEVSKEETKVANEPIVDSSTEDEPKHAIGTQAEPAMGVNEDELTIAELLVKMPEVIKPTKGVVIKEPEVTKKKIEVPLDPKDKGKEKMVEEAESETDDEAAEAKRKVLEYEASEALAKKLSLEDQERVNQEIKERKKKQAQQDKAGKAAAKKLQDKFNKEVEANVGILWDPRIKLTREKP
ncbi:hypothetical protein OSB04_031734 [Centaurea solstitialis]|uniref:Uncharacterized protein n=1 Tax=Centaurea solstitialis TaxID=347529 RepID=A0AA38W8D7_9ASTR|nr:hypothetical protein OSB04_031734 [Centaurea solstitialis]